MSKWVFLKESEDLLIQSDIFDHRIRPVSSCDLNTRQAAPSLKFPVLTLLISRAAPALPEKNQTGWCLFLPETLR